jgi:hypothetical protein
MATRKKNKSGATAERALRYVVFISHSSQDSWIANQMRKEIEALGAETWLDTVQLAGGDNIFEEIRKGLANCREALVLVTPRSIGSVWVGFEVGVLSEQRKRITPILCYAAPGDFKLLSEVKAIELNDFDDFLAQLQQRMAMTKRTR